MTKPPSPRRRPSKSRRRSTSRRWRAALLVLAVTLVFAAGLLLDPAALGALGWATVAGGFGPAVQLSALAVLLTFAGAVLVSARRGRRPVPRRRPRAAKAVPAEATV